MVAVFTLKMPQLVFTSDGVVVGVVLRSVERYDLESEAGH